MIAITNKTVIGELQYWFRKFVLNAAINKHIVPPPTNIDQLFFKEKCFIELLFNDSYSKDEYKYRFVEESFGSTPSVVTRRIQIYPGAKYVDQALLDQEGEDIFHLTNEEKVLLNALLAYRLNDSTSITIIDSTSDICVFDSTSLTLICNYNNLNSSLSKLVFLYLDLKINKNTSKYDNLDLISRDGLLNSLYEFYVLNEYFKFVSQRQPDLINN